MRILLIDDDVNLCRVLSYQLQKAKYEVQIAHRGKDGLSLFKQHSFDVVLTDYQMPDISGIQVLKSIREIDVNVIVIMITAFGSIEGALDACRIGADDYISKPFSQEQLLFVIEKAIRLKKLKEENANLHLELQNKFSFNGIVAYSEIMENILKIATKVAQSDSTVLLLGESGTGKELIARGIHFNSKRKQKPFVTVNCPSIPANLIESELFGHVKGAFTGALKDRIGKFEYADGGTVFLDEIGDLQLEIQSKLLRILQEHEFERLGDNKIIKVDVRIIAATNKDLIQQMKKGNFREDLYYRLSVVPINIPPLRERKEDIPYLTDFFLRKYQKNVKLTLEEAVLNILTQYHWPGNVRELENVIERAIVLSNNKQIEIDDLPEHLTSVDHVDKSKFAIEVSNFSLNEIERNAIEEALKKTQRNQTKAAELLKIPRHILIYRMKKYGISSKN
jgi:DNA-binding NtrC family response regulator